MRPDRQHFAVSLVPDLLELRSAAESEVAAIVVDGVESISYGAWQERSNRLAQGLIARGVQAGDRVALLLQSTEWVDYAVTYFGILKAGAIAVPISPESAPGQAARLLDHSGAVGVCCHAVAPPRPFSGWDASPADLECGQSGEQVPSRRLPSDLGEILYTSGTSDFPKGVACSHEELLFGVPPEGNNLVSKNRRDAVVLHAAPVATQAAQALLRRAAYALARMVVVPSFEPERFGTLIAAYKPTMVMLVPAMALMLVNQEVAERHDFSSVRHVGVTGSPTTPALLGALAAAFPNAGVRNNYGLTEAGAASTSMLYDPARPSSVGLPLPGTAVSVRRDDGEQLPPGSVGEIWLGKPNAPRRFYYRDPQATASVFRDGWVRTGDLGYLDDDGFLYLTDRKQDAVITGGRNVSCLQVEAVLQEHPAVAENAAFGIPHSDLGEAVVAAVVLKAPATARQLRDFAGCHLAQHEIPQRVIFLDRLPRNFSGKVLKRELRELAQGERKCVIHPRNSIEEAVARIWADVLGIDLEEVGVDDAFRDLGGQSVSAVEMIDAVNRTFKINLTMKDLALADSVDRLAALVKNRRSRHD